ncbi:MAG: pseudaminic acid synthase [Chloroflexi bacterium]|nr:pseudaminic acid synthase [Chloroflexota bacterium]|tara:strand:+ start:17 stop:1078 length:1062 start_codon:yes stop_codon:yes gene_type:complete
MNNKYIYVNNKKIGPGEPTYIIAEISANHNGSLDRAIELVNLCSESGVDAIKLQTYTADTITINEDSEIFTIPGEGLWGGKTLYELYSEAYTPWEWHKTIKDTANSLGLDMFSSAFDKSAVDFLDKINVPAYKIASFEVTDTNLIAYAATKNKPLLISTGMANISDIDNAMKAVKGVNDSNQVLLFKCVSSYPAPPEAMNLRTIPYMSEIFNVPVGLSDHTLGTEISVAAVSLGAVAIEKHVTISRNDEGPDSKFSMEVDEMKDLVDQIRNVEKGLGNIFFGPTSSEKSNLQFQRSLIVTQDMSPGEIFTGENLRSIRPGFGLSPIFLDQIIGLKASKEIVRGTPISWDMISG